MLRQNFIPINKGFTCDVCHRSVAPASRTFRNHCPFCLTSKHVDGLVPGDRASACGGLMPTVKIEGTDPDQLDLIQECQACGHTRKNRTAPDDSKDQLFRVLSGR